MILDRGHRGWAIATAVLLVASTAAYAAYASSAKGGPSGGSAMGLAFGILAAACFLFAALLAALSLAAQRLSRWLRLTPDLWRPLLFVSPLERPG